MQDNKKQIIKLFDENVRGKQADLSGFNSAHDGKEGHWLEFQMGVTPNADNKPDLLGYEMKNDTSKKITFGDWSPPIAVWKKNRPNMDIPRLDRDREFLQFFGKPNELKEGRLSWSGQPAPNINNYNDFGQKLIIDGNLNILAVYSFSEDRRGNKGTIVPVHLQKNNLILAIWEEGQLRANVEDKFNQSGWFKCIKNAQGIYTNIAFGAPINYENWINLVSEGTVFFDSGMHAGNPRPYSQWRANNSWWDSLIIDTY